MALKTESSYIDESIGLKVEGELGDFQIIEEVSDSDDADKTVNESSWAVDTVPTIPSSLVKPSSSPIGNVAVSNSENVVIGNNTYFNGPVIIKQVIQNVPGIDNPSYSKTEDEDDSEGKYHDGSQSNKKQTCEYYKNLTFLIFWLASLVTCIFKLNCIVLYIYGIINKNSDSIIIA